MNTLALPVDKCSHEHMSEKFMFQIRPISTREGFELACDGIMEKPLRVERLFEAVLLASQLGQGLDFEIQILDVAGDVAEVLELRREALLAD
jgi:hypothetical protein